MIAAFVTDDEVNLLIPPASTLSNYSFSFPFFLFLGLHSIPGGICSGEK